jgi:transcriptional regulator with XRE-family HTH domain
MELGERIQTLRKEKGISQEDLANQMGVSRQAVSKWEINQAIPDVDRILQMSILFSVSTDYLLKGIEPETTKKQGMALRTQILLFSMMNAFGVVAVWIGWVLCHDIFIGRYIGSMPGLLLIIFANAFWLNSRKKSTDPEKEKLKYVYRMINIWTFPQLLYWPIVSYIDQKAELAFFPRIPKAYYQNVINAASWRGICPGPIGYYLFYVNSIIYGWIVFIGICLFVDFLLYKRMKKADIPQQ